MLLLATVQACQQSPPNYFGKRFIFSLANLLQADSLHFRYSEAGSFDIGGFQFSFG